MKKFTLKQKRKSLLLSGMVFSVTLFSVSSSVAQLQNNAPVYIGDDSSVFVGSGTYYFGSSPGATQTTRAASTYGKLIFASGASTSGASDSHYVDGYVRTLGNSAFVFPVGQLGVYAPVKVVPTTTDGVDAAYYRANPTTFGAALDGTVAALSTIEYWDVKSALSDATLSLSWRTSSGVAALTGSTLANLTIVGWRKGGAWEKIPSTIDVTSFVGATSTLAEGSITSDSVVDLSLYSAFSLGSKGTTLANPDFNSYISMANIKDGTLDVNATIGMTEIQVYDLTGKLIQVENAEGGLSLSKPFNFAEGFYIAIIKLENSGIATQKLINRK